MFQPVSFFIGLRYSKSQSHSGFISFITFFSIAGILLGVASLITVVSVMNGFESELKKRILGIVPHVIVTADSVNSPFNEVLAAHTHITKVTPFIELEALVQSPKQLQGVLVHGVEPALEEESLLSNSIINGDIKQLSERPYQAIIGRALARRLDVTIGQPIRIVLPNQTQFTPMGRVPMQRTFIVAGIFHIGSQVDDSVVYISMRDANKLSRQKNSEDKQFRLYLDDPFQADFVVEQLKRQLPNAQYSIWKQSQGALFSAVKMEKNMMWLMLSLIVAVAAFNIVSALVMVVNDKQGEIGILQTLGMSRVDIIKIFMTQGLVNGCWGVALVTLLGLALTFGLNPIMAALGLNVFGQGYASQSLPILVEVSDIVLIVVSAFLMSLIATLYPAYRASQTQPAEVLRNE